MAESIISVDYFIIFGVLLTGYCIVRMLIWSHFGLYAPPRPPSEPFDQPGKPIDTSPISNRLQQVRQDHQVQPHGPRSSFKQSLLVESRREQLAQLRYFQRSPPPEPAEEEHGSTMLFV